jgi:hypothetical protein
MGNSVYIILNAKNKMEAGLAKARAKLRKFGGRVKSIGKSIGGAFRMMGKAVLGVGAAIGASAAIAVKAYSQQEKAEKSLSEALRAHGDNVAALMPKYKAMAAAIQDETGAADEETLARMAQLRTLNVANSEMERAIKMTMALEKAGASSKTALRASAAAIQGNTTMLTRYVPALREAKTEHEKTAIVNDLAKRGYEQVSGELDTTAGRWKELKGRVGDWLEVAGEAIAKSTGLQQILKKAADKVKELTGRFAEFVAKGGINKAVMTVKLFASNVVTTFRKGKAIVTNGAKAISKALAAPWKYAGGVIGAWANSTVEALKGIKNYAIAVIDKIKNPFQKFEPPDLTVWKESLKELGKAITEPDIDTGTKNWEKMFSELDQITKSHTDRQNKIRKEYWDAEKKRREKAIKEAKEQAAIESGKGKGGKSPFKEALKKKEQLEKKHRKAIEKLELKIADRLKKKRIDAIKAEMAERKKQIAEAKRIAAMTPKEIIAEEKAEAVAKKKAKQQAERVLRLQAKKERGIKLSREDRKFLKAVEKQKAAAKAAKDLAKKQADAQAQMNRLQTQGNRTLAQLRDEQRRHNTKLDQLLMWG